MTREFRKCGSAARYTLLSALSLACATICLPSTAQDGVIEVPLIDATRGVPLEVHGKALVHEVIEGPVIKWSWGANVVVKNTSDKAIALVFATLTELGRHPESGHRGGLGDGPKYIIAEDRFFKSDIQPSDSVVLRDTKPGTLASGCCINSIDKVRSPEAEFRVLFVQYADGTTFGDPAAAAEVFARRKASIAALQQLIESQAGDEERFSERLGQQCASLGALCPEISQAFEKSGERGALTEVRHLLVISERHAKLLALYSAN